MANYIALFVENLEICLEEYRLYCLVNFKKRGLMVI